MPSASVERQQPGVELEIGVEEVAYAALMLLSAGIQAILVL